MNSLYFNFFACFIDNYFSKNIAEFCYGYLDYGKDMQLTVGDGKR